ncbi:MAG: transposase [Nitrospiraceae bacterium]|nr:transposase [Nitrospiraceae bacterium]
MRKTYRFRLYPTGRQASVLLYVLSVCGNIQSMPLSQRTYRCPVCGSVMGRDHNAAINIKNRYVGTDCVEFTPVEMVA